MDRYTGNVNAYRQGDGTVRLEVVDGPIRVSNDLTDADPALLRLDGDVITIRGVDVEGEELVLRYRVTGEEGGGSENGWKLCEPIQNGEE